MELTGAGEFAVTTILARLVQRGLLHVKDASAPDHVAIVERRLGMLASIEGRPVPEPSVETAPAHAEDLPPAPGSHGMTAAAALAAAEPAAEEIAEACGLTAHQVGRRVGRLIMVGKVEVVGSKVLSTGRAGRTYRRTR